MMTLDTFGQPIDVLSITGAGPRERMFSGLGKAVCVPCGDVRGLGVAEQEAVASNWAPIKQDLTAAVAAFTIPFAWDRYAKKHKKKRLNRIKNVGFVVGTYLVVSVIYRAVTA